MAKLNNKKKAEINKKLWERATNSQRVKWQSLSQKSYELCSSLSGKNKFSKNWKAIEEILYE